MTVPAAQTSASDKSHVLNDIQNYLPLGCLHIPCEISVDEVIPKVPSQAYSELAKAIDTATETNLGSALFKLVLHGWVRIAHLPQKSTKNFTLLKVHLLPHDVGRISVERSKKDLQSALQIVLQSVDTSYRAWSGEELRNGYKPQKFDTWARAENCSLFYLFNTLPSPSPSPASVPDRYTRMAVNELLDSDFSVPGLETKLYPYQARSAAMMIQRESAVQLQLDPRLELRIAPDGQRYYYDARQAIFLRNPRWYETNRGGILAETMGLGKTIICLAVILATKNHLPKIPPQYQPQLKRRSEVAKLSTMAAASLQRNTIPALSFFKKLHASSGEEMTECLREVESEAVSYQIPGKPLRMNRKTSITPSRNMNLCSGTIIVVPRNLLHQWRAEIKKHVSSGDAGLRVLIMDSNSVPLPEASELKAYDVILFSRSRFESEIKDGSDSKGRRRATGTTPLSCQCSYIGATRERDCHCLKEDDLYQSPLKEIHWLRIIIDEGHDFSSASSNAAIVANKLVTAERRWVVSGTPARDRLFGVEVDLATNDNITPDQISSTEIKESHVTHRDLALEQRKVFNAKEEAGGAAKNLGLLARYFLKVEPWTETAEESKVEWDDYIYRHESFRKKTHSAFSICLRRTLENLMIKTQPDDVERDIILPSLEHRVVFLEPSFHDKIIFNLFILFLTANAITSERVDRDYLFHKESAKARGQLLSNLRQSSFFWTGFTENDIHSALEHSQRYLDKPVNEVKCTDEDRALMIQCLEFAQSLLSVTSWKALSKSHEVGLFVEHWPKDSVHAWNIIGDESTLMTGVTQLIQAQNYVNNQLSASNPTEGLEAFGQAALLQAEEARNDNPKKTEETSGTKVEVMKMGVPASGLSTDASSIKQHYAVSLGRSNHQPKTSKVRVEDKGASEGVKWATDGEKPVTSPTSKRKRLSNKGFELPADSDLRKPSIIGTTSAKLSYLIDRVNSLHKEEKILIFFDGDNTAYYLAQCLELLHIKHLIYAKSLNLETKSRYIVTFDQDESVRVLLMDIRCGAQGLNVNKASRVFFINPCNRPSVEAQAIKRAHRIGQTKPVFVETLVLKDTVEERIFERSKTMTRTEHNEARVLEDDQQVKNIIQNARPLHVDVNGVTGLEQIANLQSHQQLFGRPGRHSTRIKGIDKETEDAEGKKEATSTKKRRKGNQTVTVLPMHNSLADEPLATIQNPPAPEVNHHRVLESTSIFGMGSDGTSLTPADHARAAEDNQTSTPLPVSLSLFGGHQT